MNYADVAPVEKVWGAEHWLVNDAYCCKVLVLRAGASGSLHYHEEKDEVFVVASGCVRLEVGSAVTGEQRVASEQLLRAGDFLRIAPYTLHRFTGVEDSVVVEASTHHDDADVVRLEESVPPVLELTDYERMLASIGTTVLAEACATCGKRDPECDRWDCPHLLRSGDRWGWHDDHRHRDGTPEYRPALQQVRAEMEEFVEVVRERIPSSLESGCMLQLGMGEGDASHRMWQRLFRHVTTLDHGAVAIDDERMFGVDILSEAGLSLARGCGEEMLPYARSRVYDLVFHDASHLEADVEREYEMYKDLVRPGGIIAFHDACLRPGFEEQVTVHRFLSRLPGPVYLIGREVGIAYVIAE